MNPWVAVALGTGLGALIGWATGSRGGAGGPTGPDLRRRDIEEAEIVDRPPAPRPRPPVSFPDFMGDPRVQVIDWVRALPPSGQDGVRWSLKKEGDVLVLRSARSVEDGVLGYKQVEIETKPDGTWAGNLFVSLWWARGGDTTEPVDMTVVENYLATKSYVSSADLAAYFLDHFEDQPTPPRLLETA